MYEVKRREESWERDIVFAPAGRPATSVVFSFISQPANIHRRASETFFSSTKAISIITHVPRFSSAIPFSFFMSASSLRRRVGFHIFGASVMWPLFFASTGVLDREHTKKHCVNETRLNIVNLDLAEHVSFTIYVIIIFLLFTLLLSFTIYATCVFLDLFESDLRHFQNVRVHLYVVPTYVISVLSSSYVVHIINFYCNITTRHNLN